MDQELPTYSVVIPAYNVAGWVTEAVTSALRQLHTPLEIICVDDGSTDDTLIELRALESREHLVRVITQPNQGANAVRNTGLRLSRGEWIQFLDADDILLPDKVVRQLGASAEQPTGDLIVGAFRREDQTRPPSVSGEEKELHDAWLALVRGWLGITSANLWRREAVVCAGGWSITQRSSQEYELMFRMLQNGTRVVQCPDVGTIVRRRDGSVSRSDTAWTAWLDLRADVVDYLRNTDLWTDRRREAVSSYLYEKVKGRVAHDFLHAMTLYRRIFGINGWAAYESAPARRAAYRMIGFERTEQAIHRVRRMRDATVRKRSK